MKTILIVDDTAANLDILTKLLEQYDVISCINPKHSLEIVKEEKIDLILLDIMMPEMDGYEVCKRLKSSQSTKDIPVIFITAKTDENSIEKAYDIGGVDYVTKPFKPKELLARVKKELRIQELITSLRHSKEELLKLASIDPLTNLYNRRYFSNISKDIINIATRENQKTSILLLDIDKFKNLNDTYGHQLGDQVLVNLSQKLQQLSRDSDIVCRYGGEEFIILLPSTSIDGALVIAHKIRQTIEDEVITLVDNTEINYTLSIGVAEVYTDKEVNIKDALKRADIALYKAKNSGRNRVLHES